jgi:hypothetical protein
VDNKNETKRTWLQLKNNILKIVSNPKNGTIKIYNKKGKIIMKKNNLTKEQIKKVEEIFLGFIIKKLNDVNIKNKREDNFDPMVA